MQNNEIWRSYGTDYKEMTKRLLAQTELAEHIFSTTGKRPASSIRIGIKPNLVTPAPADFGGTTHPEIVAGIVEYLQGNGFSDLVIAEGSWVGDKTAEAFEYCGYNALSEKYGVPLLDTQKDGTYTTDAAGMKLSV